MNRQKMTFMLALTMILFLGSIVALELEKCDSAVLNAFFRTLFSESEAGYVFYGKKPVCINGYFFEDLGRLGTDSHLESTVYRQGLQTMKKIPIEKQSKFKLHLYEVPDSLVTNCYHFLFVHQEAALKEIDNNLALFQYLLGPTITPQILLDELTSPDKPFHSTLKNDKVLIGILLGFGAKNALIVSRIENIYDTLFSEETPPKLPRFLKMNLTNNLQKELLLYARGTIEKSTILIPSIGFNSLDDEANYLSSCVTISSEKLAQTPAPLFFGRIIGENEAFVNDLEHTQEEIRTLLKSEDFLSKILFEFTDTEVLIGNIDRSIYIPISSEEMCTLSKIIAKQIFWLLNNENELYVKSFFDGMRDADNQIVMKSLQKPRDLVKHKILFDISKKLEISNEKFANFKTDIQFSEILPGKLYFRTLKTCEGKELADETSIKARYLITMGENEKVLVDFFSSGIPSCIDLQDAISGLAYGLRGMKCGEIRELYIHPTLGYGIYTTLPKGEYLKVIIELVEIVPLEKRVPFPELRVADLDLHLPTEFDSIFHQELSDSGYRKGYEVWGHFKNFQGYALNDVLSEINQVKIGESELTDVESNLISRLHWNIYRKIGKI